MRKASYVSRVLLSTFGTKLILLWLIALLVSFGFSMSIGIARDQLDTQSYYLNDDMRDLAFFVDTTAAYYEAVFALPDGVGALGQSVSITATQTTGTYGMCVPLGAIVYRGEATGVYRIRTKQSVLGEVEYAEFVAVTVQETDAQSVAIDAALLAQDQVIALSNKPVSEGDRVRSTA